MSKSKDRVDELAKQVEKQRVDELAEALKRDARREQVDRSTLSGPAPTVGKVEIETKDLVGKTVLLRFRGAQELEMGDLVVYRHEDGWRILVDMAADRNGYAVFESPQQVHEYMARRDDPRFTPEVRVALGMVPLPVTPHGGVIEL